MTRKCEHTAASLATDVTVRVGDAKRAWRALVTFDSCERPADRRVVGRGTSGALRFADLLGGPMRHQ
jgi:hypothetical protein